MCTYFLARLFECGDFLQRKIAGKSKAGDAMEIQKRDRVKINSEIEFSSIENVPFLTSPRP